MSREQDLAAAVVKYLVAERWDVYQEVQPFGGGPIADIVAVRDPLVWVVECKMTYSAALLEQAKGWVCYAHRVSVAVPSPKRAGRGRSVLDLAAKALGLGRLEAANYDTGSEYYRVDEVMHGRLVRTPIMLDRLQGCLRDEHKTFAAAGNDAGRRWTPFQATCREIRKVARAHPGIPLREAIAGLDHHYASDASARSSLAKWLREGVVEGLRMERDGRQLRIYVTEDAA